MPLQNYGLNWRYGFSSWGRLNSRAEPVNFSKQIGLYVLEKRRAPVYVGRSLTLNSTIAGRIDEHFLDPEKQGEWDTFSWFGFLRVEGASTAEALEPHLHLENEIKDIEALLIYLLDPQLNRVAGRHRHLEHYEQCPDPRLGA